MALRPGRTTRKVRRPWTRVSKRKPKQSFVVGVPHPKIHVFNMGNKEKKFGKEMFLLSKDTIQIRDNALEAARISANKYLENNLGSENYFMKILVFPHQVLREHKMATGAGADRFSMGMRKAFGKPTGKAAVVRKNQKIIMVRLDEKNIPKGKMALKRASMKLPTSGIISIS